MTNAPRPKLRHPARAILAVVAAWIVFLFLVVTGFAVIALVAPLACFYVFALLGYAGILGAAHDYARRQAVVVVRAPAARELRSRLPTHFAEPRPT